jgi:hypothetical protein
MGYFLPIVEDGPDFISEIHMYTAIEFWVISWFIAVARVEVPSLSGSGFGSLR